MSGTVNWILPNHLIELVSTTTPKELLKKLLLKP